MLRFENEAVKPNRNPQKQKLKPKHLLMNISHLFICFWCQTKLKSMNPIYLEHCSMNRPMGHNDKIGQYWLSGGWSSEPIRQQGVGQHQDLVRQALSIQEKFAPLQIEIWQTGSCPHCRKLGMRFTVQQL